MSAFIVEDDTINRIVAYVQADANNPRSYHVAQYVLEEAGYRLTPEGLRGLAHELHRLNVYGVDARYGDGEGIAMSGDEPFEYREVSDPGAVQALKSLQCLVYQCSEGDVIERPLYKTLLELERVIASDIVSRMVPAYSTAAWG